jgi:diguanylate cyclase (GGDEF)-like protein
MSRPPLIERRRTPPSLVLYVAVSIAAGFGLLGWATVTQPIVATIASAGLPRIAGGASGRGLLFWIGLGLLGSLRTSAFGRRAVLTFHLPFEVAAMTLGGPVAGGWVAAVSTIELRELREVPWFGALANHAILALSGVVGGHVVVSLRTSLAGLRDPQLATLIATVAGAFVFCAIDIGMTMVVVGLREDLTISEAASTFDRSFRHTAGGEVVLGWLLALAYVAVAWWAPIVCGVLVLLVWQANDEHEMTSHDPMTGLLNRQGFRDRLEVAVSKARRGRQTATVLMLDLDGFKAVNDRLGHAAGDDVIRATGSRLKGAIRFTDVAARLGGDEFALLLERVPDVRTAEALARRIHAQRCEPLTLPAGNIAVGASLGVVFLDRTAVASDRALDIADAAMYQAKARGGGVELAAPLQTALGSSAA